MELIIRPEAESDLAAATNYCAPGGEFARRRFIQRVEERLEFLVQNPKGAPVVYSRFRRLLLHPYPFGIFYHLSGNRIFVIAVLDLRQNPESISGRLDSERG
jgi:plasmid stabilization system protein ParE